MRQVIYHIYCTIQYLYDHINSYTLHTRFIIISMGNAIRPVVKGGGHRGTVPPPKRVLCPPSQFLQIMKNGSVYCASGRTRCTPMQTAFPSVYQFFAAAATFGASSATCEASFSTLTRVLMAYRRSMTNERKRNLVILAFMRSYTKNVKMEEVLRCFSKNSRKLQLF